MYEKLMLIVGFHNGTDHLGLEQEKYKWFLIFLQYMCIFYNVLTWSPWDKFPFRLW